MCVVGGWEATNERGEKESLVGGMVAVAMKDLSPRWAKVSCVWLMFGC